jgi:predicted O-methyltransferase YrrM
VYLRNLHLNQVRAVQEYLSINDDSLFDAMEKLESSTLLQNLLKQIAQEPYFKRKNFDSIYDFGFMRVLLGVLTIGLCPKKIVETGVLHGLSSSFILAGLELNNEKKALTSIDLPSTFELGPANMDGYDDVLPPGKQSGWVVSNNYNDYWNLRIASSKEILPTLKTDSIDIFIHDSDHSYDNVFFELNESIRFVKTGGIILCDNLEANSSFTDFVRMRNLQALYLPGLVSMEDNDIKFGMFVN